jgi:hypothetical protein
MHATKAAVEEGIVPGGGVALLRASTVLKNLRVVGDEQIGVNIIARAIEDGGGFLPRQQLRNIRLGHLADGRQFFLADAQLFEALSNDERKVHSIPSLTYFSSLVSASLVFPLDIADELTNNG